MDTKKPSMRKHRGFFFPLYVNQLDCSAGQNCGSDMLHYVPLCSATAQMAQGTKKPLGLQILDAPRNASMMQVTFTK
jgi:hypothetical protein